LSNPENILCPITMEQFAEAQDQAVLALKMPRFARNVPAYFLMYLFLKEHNIIVSLSGDGMDELCGSYDYHNFIHETDNPRVLFQNWVALVRLNGAIQEDLIYDYMKSWFPFNKLGSDYINNFLFVENLTHLADDYLLRNDKLSMAHGIECRVPFMYDEFRDYMLTLPGHFKKGKDFIRTHYKDLLPDHVISRKKTGWAIPRQWYQHS